MTGLESVGGAVAFGSARIRGGSDVRFSAYEKRGGIHEDFGDSGKGVLKALVEKEIDQWILVSSIWALVRDPCCCGFSTISVRSWTNANHLS